MIFMLSSKVTNSFFIVTTIVLFFFCLFLFFWNKKLREKITILEIENKNILERKIIRNQNTDSMPIQTISHEMKKESVNKPILHQKHENKTPQKSKLEYVSKVPKQIMEDKKAETPPIKKEYPKEVIPKQLPKKNIPTTNKPYQKNVLQKRNEITSPVSIPGKEAFNMEQLTFYLNEYIKKSEKIVPKLEEQIEKPDYLKEVSEKMASELSPQNIELTDYEKEQEEHAIISYQELLASKDNLVILDDDDETINFIEELKHFRDNLN